MTSLSITIQIDLDADLDEAKLSAILDGIRGLQTRLELAGRKPLTAPAPAANYLSGPNHDGEPDQEPPPPAPTTPADVPPCKLDGCTQPSADRRGMYGRLCVTHKAEKQRRRVSQVAPPAVRDGGQSWCEYCQADRTQLHVEQHQVDVKREQARQDEARAGISHLSRPTGVGGAA